METPKRHAVQQGESLVQIHPLWHVKVNLKVGSRREHLTFPVVFWWYSNYGIVCWACELQIFFGGDIDWTPKSDDEYKRMQSKGLVPGLLPFHFGPKLTRQGKKSWDREEEKYVATWQWRHYYIVYWHLPVCGVTDGFRMSAGNILTCRRKRGERWKGGLYQVYGLLQGRNLWGFILLFLRRKLGGRKRHLWFVRNETIPNWRSVSIKEQPVAK